MNDFGFGLQAGQSVRRVRFNIAHRFHSSGLLVHAAVLLFAWLWVPTVINAKDLPKKVVDTGSSPWPSTIDSFVPVQPGEHPRLLFRKTDIPRLRAKANTQEGQAIIKRLRAQLNGSDGESLPRDFEMPEDSQDWPAGGFSISHVAGFGMLYQLTGDRKYAELGKQCFEKSLAGAATCDERYRFTDPGGALRAGPTLGWHALGYDLCYEGWDEAYRRKIARVIANYNGGRQSSLDELARGERQHPGSNHWGMQIGGAALALLAIQGDPGVNETRIRSLLEQNMEAMKINATQGFGSAGFYAEGDGCGSMASHITFLTAIQAYRTAAGKDFYTPRLNAQWMMLKWFFLTALGGDPANLRASFHERGGYPHNIWCRNTLSGGSYFGIGFGVASEEQKAAMLWFYRHSGLKALDAASGFGLDAVSGYPHHSVLALVNWPIETTERNPGEVLPHAIQDNRWSFYAWRNRWQDKDDVIISVLPVDAIGNMRAKAEKTLTIQHAGKKLQWGTIAGDFQGKSTPTKDGSTVLTTGDGSCLAIDFSRASGADVMLVMTGPGAPRDGTIEANGAKFSFLFLGGTTPTPNVDGDRIRSVAKPSPCKNRKLCWVCDRQGRPQQTTEGVLETHNRAMQSTKRVQMHVLPPTFTSASCYPP